MKISIVLAFVAFSAATNMSNAGAIAITFDDAPTKDSVILTGSARGKMLIEALKKHDVPDALFYVTTKHLHSEESQARLRRYTSAGYHLGNHSHSHQSANTLDPKDYLLDIERSKNKLASFDNLLPFHRFPFLHHGKNRENVETLQKGLKAMGYQDGYVTVDNWDFYINKKIVSAVQQGQEVNWKAAEQLYVDVLWQAITFYDNLAIKALGRSPRHVLLLHENDAAALFIGALLKKITSSGWTIISPQVAYQDPIAAKLPDGIMLNQGRIAAIAHSKGFAAALLRSNAESEDYLDALIEQRKIFNDAAIEKADKSSASGAKG